MEDRIRKAIDELRVEEAERLKWFEDFKSNPRIFPEFRDCTPDDYEQFANGE